MKLPTIYIDLPEFGHNAAPLLGSPLFARPEVIPYIEAFWSYGDGDTRTPEKRAEDVLYWARWYRDVLAAAHPNKAFRWAWWPHRFGEGITGAGDRLLGHALDGLMTGEPGPFTEHGRALHRAHARRALAWLAPRLLAEGLPNPEYVNPDFESGLPAPKDMARAHANLLADDRSRRPMFAGGVSYAEFVARMTDAAGEPLPKTFAFVPQMAVNASTWRLACVWSAVSTLGVDFVLNEALYGPVREFLPGTLCGNWGTFGSSPIGHANLWRFRETPINPSGKFCGDFAMPAMYGSEVKDGVDQPTGVGLNTFAEQLRRVGLSLADFKSKDQLAVELHARLLNNALAGCRAGTPGTRLATSLTWRGEGIWTGPDKHTDRRLFPAEYAVAVLDYNAPGVAQRIFGVLNTHAVGLLEIFAKGATVAGLNRMAETIARV